jgi:ParB family transcriptional regulator, chromosome partitioning protein
MSKQLSRLKGYMANRLESKPESPAEVATASTSEFFPPIATSIPEQPRQGAVPPSLRTMRDAVTRLGTIADEAQALIAAGDKVIEIDPEAIEDSSITDRLEVDQLKYQELLESIKAGGQRIPILVRPHPTKNDTYEIAYGRRRLRALRELKRKVRAIVLDLSDEELVIAQGQENSARLDLTFIEKVMFAVTLDDHKYSRETIEAALTVDRTMAARLLALGRRLPLEVIKAVGPAPKAGRPRWVQLADLLEKDGNLKRAQKLINAREFVSADTDTRFMRLIDALLDKVDAGSWAEHSGRRIARIEKAGGKVKIIIDAKQEAQFAEYLSTNLHEIYQQFQSART